MVARDSPPAGGRLAGDNPFGDSKFTDANWVVLDVLTEVAGELGRPPAEVALAWLLARPGVDTVLVGARRPDQLAAGLAAADLTLPAELLTRLDDVGRPDLGLAALYELPMTTALIGGGTLIRRRR